MTGTDRKPLLLLSAVAAAFFALAFWAGRVPGTWNSPDETANAFWAMRFAAGLPLAVHDPVIGLGAGTIHPRSFGVSGDALVPGSFPGLFILYGTFRGALGLPLEVLTPFFTALAGFAFFAVVRQLFDARVGLFSALLFYLHPAVIFYAARGLFHNVLVVDLLIFAAALFVLRPFGREGKRLAALNDIGGGLMIGWALATRASEAPWILLGGAVFLPLLGARRWRRFGLALLGALLPVLVLLSMNAASYGSPFRSAYAPPPIPTPAAVAEIEAVPVVPTARNSVLPFGLHPRHMLLHGGTYLAAIFWWMTALMAIGAVMFVVRWRDHGSWQRRYFLFAACTAAWLVALYGSWYVRDHYDPSRVTIGTSYVRYFLPAYVAGLPFAALGLATLVRASRSPRLVPAVIFTAATALSLRLVLFTGDENLLAVREVLRGNAHKKTYLLANLPPGAVVVTERHDKVIFPERLRIVPTLDATALQALVSLPRNVPVYWYGVRPDASSFESLATRFASAGYAMDELPAPDASEALYALRHAD